jgi:hypothetical protein
MSIKISDQDALNIGKKLVIDFKEIPLYWWKKGMEVELEHGSALGPDTNITHDDLLITGKIALAHLKEREDYYQLLEKMEESPKEKYLKIKLGDTIIAIPPLE